MPSYTVPKVIEKKKFRLLATQFQSPLFRMSLCAFSTEMEPLMHSSFCTHFGEIGFVFCDTEGIINIQGKKNTAQMFL